MRSIELAIPSEFDKSYPLLKFLLALEFVPPEISLPSTNMNYATEL